MKKGFTLIEVLVVAIIVAILASIAIPAYQSYIEGVSNDVVRASTKSIHSVLESDFLRHGEVDIPKIVEGVNFAKEIVVVTTDSKIEISHKRGNVTGSLEVGEETVKVSFTEETE
jgi:prepilin-type N-terminal cleavage/methylation domain-containing protein